MNFISLKTLYQTITSAWDSRDRGVAYVLSGMTPSATGAGTLGVTVASGTCAYGPFPGTYLNYAGGAITLTGGAANPRVDIVIINSSGTLAKVDGTAAATPVAPALPTNACLLAVCFVAANATDFTTGGGYVEDMTMIRTTPATTKGDLVVHNGNLPARLAVGTNTQVLTADSTQTTGTKWATPATASGGTPALVLGTTNTAGVATTFIRDDDTILAFDATTPAALTIGGSGVVGVAGTAARRDQGHAISSTLTVLLQGAKSANIASAATTDLSTATGNEAHITGTTAITAFGTVTAGTVMRLIFDGALKVTYNAATVILDGETDFYSQAGDKLVLVSEGSGNWREVSRAYGTAAAKYVTAALGADVTMTTSGTEYDGPSISVGAGIWLVAAHVDVSNNVQGILYQFRSQVWDGTTTYASAESLIAANGNITHSMQVVVTLTTTTTLKISSKSDQNSQKMRASTALFGVGNNATRITAVRLF